MARKPKTEIPMESGKNAGNVGYGKPPTETQFKPGNSPLGHRKKGSVSIVGLIKKVLEENEGVEAERLARSVIQNAIEGNPTALKQILDRVDGPVKEVLEVDDVTALSDAERASRTLALFDRARERRAGQAD
jgi:hypothetical protein